MRPVAARRGPDPLQGKRNLGFKFHVPLGTCASVFPRSAGSAALALRSRASYVVSNSSFVNRHYGSLIGVIIDGYQKRSTAKGKRHYNCGIVPDSHDVHVGFLIHLPRAESVEEPYTAVRVLQQRNIMPSRNYRLCMQKASPLNPTKFRLSGLSS